MKSAFKNKWLVFVLLIWTVIFCVPSLRVLLKAMAQGSPWIRFTVIPNYANSQFDPNTPELPLQVEAIKGGEEVFEWPKNFETLNKLDQLIHKNPNLPWLIALRLQVATNVFGENRVSGELSDRRLQEHLQAGIPSPETNGEKPKFTPGQIGQTLALCRQGEKLEPQNAFFSWMRTYFLLINWQDKEAWKALDEVAHKTYWNDHIIDLFNLYANSSSKMLNRPLLPIEKLDISALSDPLSFGGKREYMYRIIKWEGIKLNREGKHVPALQIWSDYHHTMTLAIQGDADLSDFSIDEGMLSAILSGVTYPSRIELKAKPAESVFTAPPDFKQIEKSREKQINAFIAYAKKYHRPDLAIQINEDAQQAHQLLQKKQNYIDDNSIFTYNFDSQYPHLEISESLFILGVILTLSLLSSLLLWLLLACYGYSYAPKNNSPQEIQPPRWPEIILGMITCSAVWPIICSVILLNLPKLITETTMGTLDHADFLYENGGNMQFWHVFILLTPLLAGSLYILQKRIEWRAKADGKKVWSGWTLLQKFFTRRWNREFCIGLLGWLGKRIFLLLLFTSWPVSVLLPEYNLPTAVTAGAFLIASFISLIWMYGKSKNTFTYRSLQLLKASLAGWISIASVLVLAILIGQVFLNRPLQKWADNQLHGEMHLLHQVKDAPPGNH